MENKKLTKYIGSIAFGTLFSRIFGYVRDMLVADLFGIGMFADVFYAVFRIPNFFKRIFGDGSFSAAFIPIFNKYLNKKTKILIQNFLNTIFSVLFFVLIIISILGVFFSPFLVKIFAGGFSSNSVKVQLAIKISRLMFPFVIFASLASFLLAALNTLRSFFLPAIAPSLFSFSEILYILFIAPVIVYNSRIKGLAISVVIGGFLHFFVQYLKLKGLGWNLKFIRFNLKHPGVRKVIFLMIPSIIGLSADQINVLIDSRCASSLGQGPVSALYYSNRLMQMPLGIFGFAFASVLLPIMSNAYLKNDMLTIKKSLSYSIRFTIFSLLPATTGLMIIGLPIVKLLFERGKFDSFGSIMTNDALFYYSIGIPGFALVKIFANAFYSFRDTKTPVKIAIYSVILHVLLCFLLMYKIGVGGLALSTSLSTYFNLLLLIFYIRKKIGGFDSQKILNSFLKTVFASIITGIVSYNTCKISEKLFISVPISIFLGLIAFILTSYILKSDELKMIILNIFSNKK
ncbi:MAG: murein biosynthesis integral membrane protein MurJ [Endomicrobium sp.]|jgi:putative peptidoglycan lipid II flippase|nr:murein biosynthesis integral membrane protein MurJ [Endomicrobium sp.]